MAGTEKWNVRRGGTFRIRGSKLTCVTAGAPGGDRELGAAGSFNSRPFNSGSDFKPEFNGMFTKNFNSPDSPCSKIQESHGAIMRHKENVRICRAVTSSEHFACMATAY
jgi:hypothetical protein